MPMAAKFPAISRLMMPCRRLQIRTARSIVTGSIPLDAFADSLRGILPPWQVDGLLEDYAHYRRGEAVALFPAVTDITRRPPTDVWQFARDYAPAFRGLTGLPTAAVKDMQRVVAPPNSNRSCTPRAVSH